MIVAHKINCLIVDDEPLAAEGIKIYADKLEYLTIEAVCYSAVEALAILNSKEIDLIFLDVNMPDLTGIEFLEQLKNPQLTIFTTAYSEFAIDGFRLNAVDYILKPISFARFVQAVEKAKAQLAIQRPSPSLPIPTSKEVYLKQDNEFIRVCTEKILFIEAMQNYIIIHQADKKNTIHQTMSAAEELLVGLPFFRTHRSYLINIAHIDSIRGNTITIKGHEVPLSKHRREELFELVVDKRLFNK